MEDEGTGRRPTKTVLGAAGLFFLAVLLGRLLIAGGPAWIAFLVALPILLFVLSAAAGFRFALGATLVFALTVLAVRWFLERNPTGWAVLALLPIVAFTALIVGKVLAQMRRDRKAMRAASPSEEPEKQEEGEKGTRDGV